MSSIPRVLIVDDEPDWRDLLAGRLRRDFRVEEASSLSQALDILIRADDVFHLVVLDLSLKGAGNDREGLQIADYVRKSSAVTSVIVVTGFPDIPSARQAFRDYQAVDYIEKVPTEKGKVFDLDDFERIARNAIDSAVRRYKEAFVFVVMPFSPQFSEIYRQVVKPSILEEGLIALRADDFFEPRRIMEDVERAIGEAALIVADLTGRNPNVFYEVGMAHALGHPTILLTQNLEEVPPRLRDVRCIVYEDSFIGARLMKENLRRAIQSIKSTDTKREPFFKLPPEQFQTQPSFCFVLKPSASVQDQIYDPIVRPLLNELHFVGLTPERVFSVKHELDEIWGFLNQANLILADLTDRDPEVFYLLGVCRGIGKNTILMAQSEKDIPFDLLGPSRIIYALRPFHKGEEARQKLESLLRQFHKSV